MTRIGFAGLGRMGAHMAANLADAGFEMYVWNRSAGTAADVARDHGAVACSTPRELAESVDLVITMLADDAASEDVHLGDDGLLAAVHGAGHVIEMGTHSPRHIRDLADRAGERTIVDAPVSGSIGAARDASLLIMVGATRAGARAYEPALSALGRDVVFLGPLGAGATMKLAVNMLIHSLNQAVAESLLLASAAGIDPRDAYGILEQSAAASPMLTYRKPQYLEADRSPVSFALRLARKDVELAIDLASENHVTLPQTQVNLDQLRAAESGGYADHDMAAMIEYMKEHA